MYFVPVFLLGVIHTSFQNKLSGSLSHIFLFSQNLYSRTERANRLHSFPICPFHNQRSLKVFCFFKFLLKAHVYTCFFKNNIFLFTFQGYFHTYIIFITVNSPIFQNVKLIAQRYTYKQLYPVQ